jgi:hypothetical protein
VRDVDLGWAARKRIRERRDERADLAAFRHCVDDFAAVRAQHAALIGHTDLREPLA